MSGDANRSSAEPRPSAAADVTFASFSEGRRQQGESSSLAESRGSGERWSERGERLKERFLTPDRRSEGDNGADTGSEKKRRSGLRKSGGGGFLRDGIFGNGTPASTEKGSERKEGKRKVELGGLQVGNKRLAGSRLSGDSSVRSSPLSREVSISQPTHDGAQDQHTNTRPTTMDPAQLVQMALSLSESRKRHASGSLPVPMAVPRSRNVSGTSDKYGTVRTRGADRQRLSSQFNTPSPVSSTRSRDRQPAPSANAIDDNVLYTFSPATLARAGRTRKYFELANDHRRLLQLLPPLKPDANSAANYTFESRSSPGYTAPDIRRVRSNTTSRQELGRQYNPLQILRNRRMRVRERCPLTVPSESFADSQHVATWLDDVENAAQRPDYRTGTDVVQLPDFLQQIEGLMDGEPETGKGHRRTGTTSSVITRPENEWTVDPTERLADTYWTEQEDNKTLIENKGRQTIFPSRVKSATKDARKSDDLSRGDLNSTPMEVMDEETEQEKAPRKHRHLLSLHKADRIRHNRLSRHGRSASVSSGSEGEGRQPRSSARGNGDIESVAPLNKHMDALIARDQRGELSSPDHDSPDHWDSKNTPFPARNEQRGSISRANGSLSVVERVAAQRSKSADGRLAQLAENDRARFSFDSTAPDSPAVADFMPSLAMDLSPPRKQATPAIQKQKHRILPKFHTKNKDRITTEGRDFAFPSDSDRSREPSGNAIDPTRLSAEYQRPNGLLQHQTSESISSSIHRRGPSRTQTHTSEHSFKEAGSTVGRFFKGGRLAELVRSDRKGRKEQEGSITDTSAIPSDASDTDGSVGEPSLTIGSPHDSEPSPRTSIDRVRTKKGLHTANLPTFTSAAVRDKLAPSKLTPVISHDGEDDDHIGRQAAQHRGASRSPRIDRLLPPRINLPDDTDYASTADIPSQTSDVIFAEPNRKSYGFLAPRSTTPSATNPNVSFTGTDKKYPVTGLTKLQANGGRRHWSISDRGMREQHRQDLFKVQRVSTRDIGRARALLLASGIKAHNLVARANDPTIPTPKYLAAAAKTASVDAPQVPLKETHLRASIILSSHLDKSLESLSQSRQSFQADTSNALHTRLSDLKSFVADKLTHTVHNSSDEADAFGVRLTTEQTLRIKQVDDAVDEILRMRRRQFRLMKRAGFKLLEWLVLGVMWWVWFLVVCWKSVRKVIVALIKVLRWLFSF
jgi:hypothetical protein